MAAAIPASEGRPRATLSSLPPEIKLLIVRACEELDAVEEDDWEQPANGADAGDEDDWVDDDEVEEVEDDEEEEEEEEGHHGCCGGGGRGGFTFGMKMGANGRPEVGAWQNGKKLDLDFGTGKGKKEDEAPEEPLAVVSLAAVNHEFRELCLPSLWRDLDLEGCSNDVLSNLIRSGILEKYGKLVQYLFVRTLRENNLSEDDDASEACGCDDHFAEDTRETRISTILEHLPNLVELDVDLDCRSPYAKGEKDVESADESISPILKTILVTRRGALTRLDLTGGPNDDVDLPEELAVRIILAHPLLMFLAFDSMEDNEASRVLNTRASDELDKIVKAQCTAAQIRLPMLSAGELASILQYAPILSPLPAAWKIPDKPETMLEALATLQHLEALEVQDVSGFHDACAFIEFAGPLTSLVLNGTEFLHDRALDVFIRRNGAKLDNIAIEDLPDPDGVNAEHMKWLHSNNRPLFEKDFPEENLDEVAFFEELFQAKTIPPYDLPKLAHLSLSIVGFTKARVERFSKAPIRTISIGSVPRLREADVEGWLRGLPNSKDATAPTSPDTSKTNEAGEKIDGDSSAVTVQPRAAMTEAFKERRREAQAAGVPWASLERLQLLYDEIDWSKGEIENLEMLADAKGIWVKMAEADRWEDDGTVDSDDLEFDDDEDDEIGEDEEEDEEDDEEQTFPLSPSL